MQADTPDVSILVVGFNSLRFLDRCFAAIDRATLPLQAEVLFINNGSDQSERHVANNFPHVRVVESRGNIGFAAANNVLAAEARGPLLLLLNPDTEVDPHAIELLVKTALAEADYGIIGGSTIASTGSKGRMPQIALPTTRRLLGKLISRAVRPAGHFQGLTEVDATSGGFMLVRHDLWRELGGMDERFFLYAEDLDICKRATEAGARIGEVGGATITHAIGSGEFFSPARQTYLAKGNATYHRKHFAFPRAQLNLGLIWTELLLRSTLAAIAGITNPEARKKSRALAPLAFFPWRWMGGY